VDVFFRDGRCKKQKQKVNRTEVFEGGGEIKERIKEVAGKKGMKENREVERCRAEMQIPSA